MIYKYLFLTAIVAVFYMFLFIIPMVAASFAGQENKMVAIMLIGWLIISYYIIVRQFKRKAQSISMDRSKIITASVLILLMPVILYATYTLILLIVFASQ